MPQSAFRHARPSARAAFIPRHPTLWPRMLLARARTPPFAPFSAGDVRWFEHSAAALRLAAQRLRLAGREVLVPAFHHGAEIAALEEAGARPRFYAVDARGQADIDDLSRRIGAGTAAIYISHVGGVAAPAAAAKALAMEHGLTLIEDCSEALLSAGADGPVGGHGDLALFRLTGTLPVADGAALVCNARIRIPGAELPPPPRRAVWRSTLGGLADNRAMRRRRWPGRYGREPVLPAAPGAALRGASPLSLRVARSLPMGDIITRRRENYQLLQAALGGDAAALPEGACPQYYPLLVDDRSAALHVLHLHGVQATAPWADPHPACDPDRFPQAQSLRRRLIELPCHQDLDELQMEQIAKAASEAIAAQRRRRTPARVRAAG